MRQEVIDKITKNKLSKQVDLANMNINDAEIQEIMDKIQEISPTVSEFILDNNALIDAGALILSKSLEHFKQIGKLSVQFNQINTEGAISLFSLKNNFANLDIHFHGNQINDVEEMLNIEKMAQQKIGFK